MAGWGWKILPPVATCLGEGESPCGCVGVKAPPSLPQSLRVWVWEGCCVVGVKAPPPAPPPVTPRWHKGEASAHRMAALCSGAESQPRSLTPSLSPVQAGQAESSHEEAHR